MFIIKVKLDLEKDAWNWQHACNTVSHGVDWKRSVDKLLWQNIYNIPEDKAYDFLIPYLKEQHSKISPGFIKDIQSGFDERKEKIFSIMEKITNRPIYRKKFTCFITTFPRFPYNFSKGYIWISHKKLIDSQVAIFMHELLHFQFFTYFGDLVLKEIGLEKQQRLKEAMTVILNDEWKEVTHEQDEGYDIDQPLRKILLAAWRRNKNMDTFIEEAIQIMK